MAHIPLETHKITVVAQDETTITIAVEKIVAARIRSVRDDYSLTIRETEILLYLFQGMSQPKIAQKIFISKTTVTDHVRSICRKMECNSVTQVLANTLNTAYITLTDVETREHRKILRKRL